MKIPIIGGPMDGGEFDLDEYNKSTKKKIKIDGYFNPETCKINIEMMKYSYQSKNINGQLKMICAGKLLDKIEGGK